ncbi:hypothetical protein AB1N83_001581 [Pleurotus pulmonarius]
MQSGGAVALAACICSMHGVITIDEYAIVIIQDHYLYIELVIGIHFASLRIACLGGDGFPYRTRDEACGRVTTRRFKRQSFNKVDQRRQVVTKSERINEARGNNTYNSTLEVISM